MVEFKTDAVLELKTEIDDLLNTGYLNGKQQYTLFKSIRTVLQMVGVFKVSPPNSNFQQELMVFYFIKIDGRIVTYRVSEDCMEFKYFIELSFEFASSSSLYNNFLLHLQVHAFNECDELSVRQIADANDTCVRIFAGSSSDRGSELIYEISPKNISNYYNGYKSVIFENTDNEGRKKQSFRLIDTSNTKSGFLRSIILDQFNFDANYISPEYQKILLLLMILIPFFLTELPAIPFFLIMCEHGGGKTTLLKAVGKLVFGRNFDVSHVTDEKSFIALITSGNPLGYIDEINSYIDFLAQRITECCTSGRVLKKKYYTTNTLVSYKTHSSLAFTAIEFKNKRLDTLSRAIPIELLPPEKKISESVIYKNIDEHYDELMTELCYLIQKILQDLELPQVKSLDMPAGFRFPDVGKILFSLCNLDYDMFSEIVNEIVGAQLQLSSSTEILIFLLELWVEKNDGIEVDSKTLFQGLQKLARENGISKSFYIQDPTKLGTRLYTLRALIDNHFVFSKRPGGKNKTLYKFNKK